MEIKKATEALAALAQSTRLEIFRFLVKAGHQGVAAGEIAARFDLPASTLSFHIKTLKQAGLVGGRRESRSLIYAVDFEAMNRLLGYLLENCCEGAGCDVERLTNKMTC